MPVQTQQLQAILLDLGNTLIEFGPRQVTIQNTALQDALTEVLGSCDLTRLGAIRHRQMMAPYEREFRELSFDESCTELIRELAGRPPTPREVERLVRVRQEAFLRSVTPSEDVHPLLERLATRYRLALVSNYPCGWCIRQALDRTGLTRHLDAVAISGEVGFAKPHPAPFRVVLEELGLEPAACLHVGDNWLADVQGAKRLGMQAVHTRQYVPYERLDPQEEDLPADAVIQHLGELEDLLL